MTQKIALVTGGNRGIGLSSCKLFSENGIKVYMGCRDVSEAQKIIKQDKLANIFPVNLDVTNHDSIVEAINDIMVKENRIDILINNAGVYLDGDDSLLELDSEIFLKTINTNFIAPYLMIKEILPIMISNNYGRIVNVSSGYGQAECLIQPGVGSYKISKYSLNGLTRMFASELDEKNIKINSICPGWVKTDMGGPNAPRSPEQAAKGILWAATLEENGPNGGFFRDGNSLDW